MVRGFEGSGVSVKSLGVVLYSCKQGNDLRIEGLEGFSTKSGVVCSILLNTKVFNKTLKGIQGCSWRP